ncbi:MAG: glutamine--fructose-6-phosphate transaminase (isomerizing), partial [candidate division NC10 bacterium]|nr:glutamine--fructose-6-phosphate transaminase (isomerizing) [candidate division NC10 bacterium]
NALWGRELAGEIGLGHTRWATHGRPTENNAHPHSDCTGDLVVVHNGIIENYLALKEQLRQEGHHFKSDTDTDVIAHLIETHLKETGDLELAVRRALAGIVGTYALGILWRGDPHRLIAARNGSPLVVGLGDGEFLIASDLPAILSHTRDVLFLDDEEVVVLSHDGVNVTTLVGEPVEKKVQKILWTPLMAEKSGYKHFMLKEIYEQPRAIRDTIRGRFSLESGQLYLEGLEAVHDALQTIDRIVVVACGTSWHAGLVGKFLIEDLARIPVEVDYGSEFRYRDPILNERTLVITISQSGETLDTLVSLREARRRGCKSLAICNVVGSTLSRESDGVLYTHAGPEIGVASTKAFTTQLAALYLLALALGRARGRLDGSRTQELLSELIRLPQRMEQALSLGPTIEELATRFHAASNFLYLGRGINYPIALEGALKLKEISYIHAEGYPAGEMKHGPIALITEEMPVVFLAPNDKTIEKVVSNIEEVKTRNGIVIAISDETDSRLLAKADHLVGVPHTSPHLMPLLLVVPLQLLAYHIAVRNGCDVDQPRNLAKSVTVE